MQNGSNTCALCRFDLVFHHKTFTSSHRPTPTLTQDTQANRVVCSMDGAIVDGDGVGGKSSRYSDWYDVACRLRKIVKRRLKFCRHLKVSTKSVHLKSALCLRRRLMRTDANTHSFTECEIRGELTLSR